MVHERPLNEDEGGELVAINSVYHKIVVAPNVSRVCLRGGYGCNFLHSFPTLSTPATATTTCALEMKIVQPTLCTSQAHPTPTTLCPHPALCPNDIKVLSPSSFLRKFKMPPVKELHCEPRKTRACAHTSCSTSPM